MVMPMSVMATSYIVIYRKLRQSHAKVKPGMVFTVSSRRDPPQGSCLQETSVTNTARVDGMDRQCLSSTNDNNVSYTGHGSGDNTTKTGGNQWNQRERRIQARVERKVAKTGAILILTYFMCWSPYAVVNSCYLRGFDIHRYIQVAAMWIVYSNSVFNPLIYTWTNPLMRGKLIDFLKKTPCNRSKGDN
ncbi:5-hydroxytryptamine receptor 1-like [Ptychodera flava]|uniref:5-hydroxytryptamine receptor 1-like n=1 Tax=Ptychodera flava TaxID=63121 RepID=UPI00396A1D2F